MKEKLGKEGGKTIGFHGNRYTIIIQNISKKERWFMTMKKTLTIVLTFIMAFGVFSVAYADSEVPDGYTPIYTAEDLNNIRNDLDGKYILMNDIDMSVYENWEPIGTYNDPFSGEFNGNGHKISNIFSVGGLFEILYHSSVKNLSICNSNISLYIGVANRYVGFLSNQAWDSVIENCCTEGTMFATTGNSPLAIAYDFCPGGLVGFSEKTLFKNCFSIPDFSLEYTVMSIYAAGGLAGESKNCEFICCYAIPEFKETFIGYGNTEGMGIHTGGIIGNTLSGDAFEYCYYEKHSASALGTSDIQEPNITGLSVEEMKNQTSYAGFDFENIWKMEESGYAVLNFEKIKENHSNDSSGAERKLIAAEILCVPLKNRIVFGKSPSSPSGIKVKIKYSDNTMETHTVTESEKHIYCLGKEILNESSETNRKPYGIKEAEYSLGKEEISLCYKYLAIPSVTDYIYEFLSLINIK